MAKGNNQKLKMLYLVKIFSEHTDEEHGLTLKEIIAMLNEYEVTADRKTLYLDFEELRYFGYDIVKEKINYQTYYKLVSRDFELPELKLLVDSVQSAKFITERKSRELIKKLEKLVSSYEGKQLHRQVLIAGRVKTMNESIYYSIDKIHTAINENVKIRFKYFQWNLKKEPKLRHDGAVYHISPWALTWDDEYYYMIGYDSDAEKIKHYRVDKMIELTVTADLCEGKEAFEAVELPSYANSLFGMFGGKEETVTLECENTMVGTIIDRFGKDIMIFPTDEDHFRTHVKVSVSRQFLGWIMALGKGVKIVAPQSVVDMMKDEINSLVENYL